MLQLRPLFRTSCVLFSILCTAFHTTGAAPSKWWSQPIDQALANSSTNRPELETALEKVPEGQREGLQFLLENMPEPDLKRLSGQYLLENVALAYDAWNKAAWHDRVPKEIFLNEILPYASINEARDDWRQVLREKCAPLVEGCKTPGEAAHRLNQKLFKLVQVKYSTERKKADQSPLESMKSGLASCTGLSVLLIDACRSVGVPARLVGTPLWFNNRGNHTWVEVWDETWHFAGAAEPDSKGLDRGWFVHDASQALKDVPEHAIYATSFKKTGLAFPMVWAPSVRYVSAANVTERYTPKSKPEEKDTPRLLVKVLDRPAGKRVAAKVRVIDSSNPTAKLEGTSRDESADTNDILPFTIQKDRTYTVEVEQDGKKVRQEFRPGTNAQPLLVLALNNTLSPTAPSMVCYIPVRPTKALAAATEEKLKMALTAFFEASAEKQSTWKFSSSLDRLLKANEPAVRQTAWETYKAASIHSAAKADYESKQARYAKYVSAYTVKEVSTKPKDGWPLFIAMHGGGGAPKEVNDSQWEIMKRYYKDHPEQGGYLYLALRAPNDSWNGFYDVYVYPLIENLIRQFLLFGDVDANKVFIMGYSHGGYGAFAIGPKIPYRFAAIHASASAPTDGETTGKTLRNTIFTHMVGDLDTMYGRYDRNIKFSKQIEEWRGERKDIYPVTFQLIKGNGHGGLPDRDKIKDMYPAVRNPVPTELTWLMTDKVVTNFFWLQTSSPGKKREIDATCKENSLTVTTTTNVSAATVLLDSRLVDFAKPLRLEVNGKTSSRKIQPGLLVLCQTLMERGDPELAFTARLDLELKEKQAQAATRKQRLVMNQRSP
jgi:predicted esterase